MDKSFYNRWIYLYEKLHNTRETKVGPCGHDGTMAKIKSCFSLHLLPRSCYLSIESPTFFHFWNRTKSTWSSRGLVWARRHAGFSQAFVSLFNGFLVCWLQEKWERTSLVINNPISSRVTGDFCISAAWISHRSPQFMDSCSGKHLG